MELTFLAKGLTIGFLIAVPVGPIGILCIRRSLARGPLSGLLTGLGAATADACYGAVAAFGLTLISNFLVHQRFALQLIGALFLVYLGIKTFFETPASTTNRYENNANRFSDYFSTLGLTLTNPATIISFSALFASANITASNSYLSASLLVLGVFLGSALWWLILSNGIGLLRGSAREKALPIVNKISGVIIIGFSTTLLFTIFR